MIVLPRDKIIVPSFAGHLTFVTILRVSIGFCCKAESLRKDLECEKFEIRFGQWSVVTISDW
jgi:hypothetical protein